MRKVEVVFPPLKANRGARYWLRAANLVASNRKFLRADYSNEWRYAFEQANPPQNSRSTPFSELTRTQNTPDTFRFIVVGDTGEGDHSQYSLLPLMHAVRAQFMIVNGDIAYPIGSYDDFDAGFFEPYASLRIPIWATPGNHEYYSKSNGREFHEIFCTRKAEDRWQRHGIPHVLQPGMYWEMRDPEGKTPLVVIGVDSGKKANLDGHTGWTTRLNPFARSKGPDTKQHSWLERRLQLADRQNKKVMVLFHIPGLVSRKHDKGTHFGELHRILLRHPSVRLVIGGHIHNHQEFKPVMFQRYAEEKHAALRPLHDPPHYVVTGNGGATLDSPVFKGDRYVESDVYPSHDQWHKYAVMGQAMIDRMGSVKSNITRFAGHFKKAAALDVDPTQLQSFLLIDCLPEGKVRVSRIHLNNLYDLYRDGTRTRIDNPNPPFENDPLKTSTKRMFEL